MDHQCSNCLFGDLNYNALPCAECRNKSQWHNSIEHMVGGYEMQSAILKTQMYILRELGDLRGRLDKLEPGQWDLTLKRRD